MQGQVSSKLASELKTQGWKHNQHDGWMTTNLKSAAFLRDHCSDKAKEIINRAFIKYTPWESALVIPRGVKLIKHQPPAVKFALSRSRSYLALAPGLGKTIVAAIIAATLGKRCIYVCPPFLTLNTLEEFKKFAPSLHTKVLDNADWIVPDVLIIPDSQLTNKEVRSYIRLFKPQVFIGDEWHRYKTDSAQRSRAMNGYTDNRKNPPYQPGILDGKFLEHIVVMSGTPMPNRPIELFSTFKKLAPEYINFMSKNEYGKKYCNAFKVVSDYNGAVYGLDMTGCNKKTFKKLMKRIRTKDAEREDAFMLRQTKDILGLPKLYEEPIILGLDMPKKLKSLDAKLLKMYSPQDVLKWTIRKEMGLSEEDEDIHLMTYRRLLGQYKVKPSADYIKGLLEDDERNNLLVVAYHKEVIAGLAEKLNKYDPLIITGDVKPNKRQGIVKEYQSNKKKRIILGNLNAIGVGFTLTKANYIPLVEYAWDDGNNRQVIDRAHRIGLKHEVNAQYLVFRNSLDRSIIETLLDKQQVTKLV